MDDQSDPAVSKQKMTDQVDSAAIAVLGPTFSNSAAEADPVANDAGMTVLAEQLSDGGIAHMPTCAVARFTWYEPDWDVASAVDPATWSFDSPR